METTAQIMRTDKLEDGNRGLTVVIVANQEQYKEIIQAEDKTGNIPITIKTK